MPRLIAEADEDGNGAINLEEFCNHMRKRYGISVVLWTTVVKRRRAVPTAPAESCSWDG